MTLNDFLEAVKTGEPLDTAEIHQLMDDMSNEAIEKALSRELGRPVSLADLQVVAAQ